MNKIKQTKRSYKFLTRAIILVSTLISVNIARADYSYTFTYTPSIGNFGGFSGSFSTSAPVLGYSYDNPVTSGNITFPIQFTNTYRVNFTADTVVGDANFGRINLGGITSGGVSGFNLSGFVNSYSNEGFSAEVTTFARGEVDGRRSTNSGAGLFEALLSSSSPDGSTGGAPSPEVNAGLGILLAGATILFLRRRKGGHPSAAPYHVA